MTLWSIYVFSSGGKEWLECLRLAYATNSDNDIIKKTELIIHEAA